MNLFQPITAIIALQHPNRIQLKSKANITAHTGLQKRRGKITEELLEIKELILEYLIVPILEQLLSAEVLGMFCRPPQGNKS